MVDRVDYDPTLTPEEEKFLVDAAKSVNDFEAAERVISARKNTVRMLFSLNLYRTQIYKPTLPKDYRVVADDKAESMTNSKESKVPSSRIGRCPLSFILCLFHVQNGHFWTAGIGTGRRGDGRGDEENFGDGHPDRGTAQKPLPLTT